MDALRLERLVWSVVFGAFVAIPVGLLVAPDPTGLLPVLLAGATLAVSIPVAFRLFEYSESRLAEAGDMTARFVTLFSVAFALRFALSAVGVGGFVGNLVAFGGGWLSASYASERLNPRRWGGGGVSS
ncbi:hypothetical protein [Halogeometricum limi]|uniref:Uncharacterized protein n=1 Tax=Halogeometricum limi TaxID=555875 RepID=A0A1I6FYY0_9EURY|nr:hypothetical protein [Halogeometricum limi]SFR35148.1 hypothetical protein SAMN04488124_0572 [Halogeometricum limi]